MPGLISDAIHIEYEHVCFGEAAIIRPGEPPTGRHTISKSAIVFLKRGTPPTWLHLSTRGRSPEPKKKHVRFNAPHDVGTMVCIWSERCVGNSHKPYRPPTDRPTNRARRIGNSYKPYKPPTNRPTNRARRIRNTYKPYKPLRMGWKI